MEAEEGRVLDNVHVLPDDIFRLLVGLLLDGTPLSPAAVRQPPVLHAGTAAVVLLRGASRRARQLVDSHPAFWVLLRPAVAAAVRDGDGERLERLRTIGGRGVWKEKDGEEDGEEEKGREAILVDLVLAASRPIAPALRLVDARLSRQAMPRRLFTPDTWNHVMTMAVELGLPGSVRALMHGGCEVDVDVLALAVRNGAVHVVRMLVDEGFVDPGEDESRPLLLASKHGQAAIVRLLLEDGRADPRAQGHLALRTAVQQGHLDVYVILAADSRVSAQARRLVSEMVMRGP